LWNYSYIELPTDTVVELFIHRITHTDTVDVVSQSTFVH